MLNYAKLKKWFGSVAEGGSHGQVCNSVQIETKELEGATISIWEVCWEKYSNTCVLFSKQLYNIFSGI